jgi:putative glutamine amidotransferase
MRTVENRTYPERRDALAHDWGALFASHGIVPILVPNTVVDISAYMNLGARGLLLTGGDNLGTDGAPSARDRAETLLLDEAIGAALPVFGVCRGLQMVNRYFGGSIARELPELHVGNHSVTLDSGQQFDVNSFHNEGVMREGLSRDLVPFAQTAAGVVEAVRHKKMPVTAIQWHPERASPSAKLDRSLITEWLTACA